MDHAPTLQHLYDLINAADIDGFARELADDFSEREDLPDFPPNKDGTTSSFRC
jgi:hypothetical protein